MATLSLTEKMQSTATGIEAGVTDGFRLKIHLVSETALRIALVPGEGFSVPKTWMVAPDGEVPWEGRDRLSADGFAVPAFEKVENGVQSDRLKVEVEPSPLRLVVSQKIGGDWVRFCEDRPGGAYQWFERGHRFKHFQLLDPDAAHYGLGDKTGPLDRTGRRLRCLQSDALGYDAERSDPLYKHAPFVIADNGRSAAGLFYDTMAETVFDLGAEHSNYFRRYRHVETHERGLVFYVLAGRRVADVVPQLHGLTGRIAFPPRWSLGFAFTTMHHADAPNAQKVITDFAQEARRRKLPISAIHLGSGYTAGDDGLRYVFNWNESRFPDRAKFFADLNAMGFRTCANIKPVLLTGHEAFGEAAKHGWFVRRADGSPAIEMFWGGEGASLDFTNPKAIGWWKKGVAEQVLGAGFDAVWNDNNEAELWDETAAIEGFGAPLNGMEVRPVHALLMTRASHEAMLAAKPDERPYTISRAGPIGISRYGETWSGDNRTSWHTLKWNLRQGLSMSLSGFPLVGHDIGGFDGPPPDAELLVRWFQMMALHPRCVMNSWKADFDNIPNLPWMHEDVFEHVKAALRLRYRFLPLLYSLIREAGKSGDPVVAPAFYYFDDPECRADCDTFMLGRDVLVAPVVDAGATEVEIYLPECPEGWVDVAGESRLGGGQRVRLAAPLDTLLIFVRGGSVLPLAAQWPETAPHDASKVVLTAFSGAGSGKRRSMLYFDDGLGWGYQDRDASLLVCDFSWGKGEARLEVCELWSGRGRPELSSRCIGSGDFTTDWGDIGG